MEPQGTLPFAALSLHALAPPGAFPARTAKPRQAPGSLSIPRNGPRSHPIAARLLTEPVGCEVRCSEHNEPQSNALTRLVAAVPAALGRLLSQPMPKAPFTAPSRLSESRVFPSALRLRAARGGAARPAGGGGRKPVIMWFRNDLRLHDNPSLERACREGSSLLPVYVFDPREYEQTPGGFPRTGPTRAQFILEAVADLRTRLQAAGSDLIVRQGRAEAVLAGLAAAVGAGAVYCQTEAVAGGGCGGDRGSGGRASGVEDARVEGAVAAALDRSGVRLKACWGGTLFHPEDLPFKLSGMPTTYAEFRSRVAGLAVRPLAESEGAIRCLPTGVSIEPGEVPSLSQLGFNTPPPATQQHRGGFAAPLPMGRPVLRGGESEALRHLQAFAAELKANLSSRNTGRTSVAPPASTSPAASASSPSPAFSCRISPWLALGCLSPRRMFHEMRQQLGGTPVIPPPAPPTLSAPAAVGSGLPASDSASPATNNWLVFELLWRDFFRFVSAKYSEHSHLVAA